MKRRYRPFPYFNVLTDLLSGMGYKATAKKYGYLEENSPDPTKRFRTLLRYARNNGFIHEGMIVRFPAFDRQGRVVKPVKTKSSLFTEESDEDLNWIKGKR